MKIIVRVEGGLVQAVYADGEAEVEIIDLDVLDFAYKEEYEEADKRKAEMENTISQKGWRQVW